MPLDRRANGVRLDQRVRQASWVLLVHKGSAAPLVRRGSPDRLDLQDPAVSQDPSVLQAHAENRVLQDLRVPEESLALVEKRVP